MVWIKNIPWHHMQENNRIKIHQSTRICSPAFSETLSYLTKLKAQNSTCIVTNDLVLVFFNAKTMEFFWFRWLLSLLTYLAERSEEHIQYAKKWWFALGMKCFLLQCANISFPLKWQTKLPRAPGNSQCISKCLVNC